MEEPVDGVFTRALPKVELHAHLSGSISKQTLHRIWTRKQSKGQCLELGDPLIALGEMPNIFTFFRIFNDYIYKLVDDEETIREATLAVVNDFQDDGVAYLELRTTPRNIPSSGIDRSAYVRTVLETLRSRANATSDGGIEVHLLLSIDRSMTPEEASEVVALAHQYGPGSQWHQTHSERTSLPLVLGVDLCGNPMKGDVNSLTPAFAETRALGLRITLHFAEVPESSTDEELAVLLSWRPDRLGHVINVSERFKQEIKAQAIALELCLSCNVIAEMVRGGFARHHFGDWYETTSTIALSTDDVGVFGSLLSNEYLLAATHFGLNRGHLVDLSQRAVRAAFMGHPRMEILLKRFRTQEGLKQ